MKIRLSKTLLTRVFVQSLTELVPPLAIASFGRGMVLVGTGFEALGGTLKSSGALVEAYGEEQVLRSSAWLTPTAPPSRHAQPSAPTISPATTGASN